MTLGIDYSPDSNINSRRANYFTCTGCRSLTQVSKLIKVVKIVIFCQQKLRKQDALFQNAIFCGKQYTGSSKAKLRCPANTQESTYRKYNNKTEVLKFFSNQLENEKLLRQRELFCAYKLDMFIQMVRIRQRFVKFVSITSRFLSLQKQLHYLSNHF